jgi:hypothetical protein
MRPRLAPRRSRGKPRANRLAESPSDSVSNGPAHLSFASSSARSRARSSRDSVSWWNMVHLPSGGYVWRTKQPGGNRHSGDRCRRPEAGPRVTAVRIVALLVLAAVAVTAPTASASPRASETLPRSCGALSIGIAWHVRATRNVRCSLARLVIHTFLDRPGCRSHCVVRGYPCRARFLAKSEQVQCVPGRRVVVAKSFGY